MLNGQKTLAVAAPKQTNFTDIFVWQPINGRYWMISALLVLIYLAINAVTDSHQLRGSGITLWSPDNGLSLLLILESISFAPVIFLSESLSDVLVHNVSHNIYVTLLSEFSLTFGYVLLSLLLRIVLKFSLRTFSFDNLMILLSIVPVGTALTMSLLCGVLYLSGSLPGVNLYDAAYSFWLGDVVGIVIIIPGVMAFYQILTAFNWRNFASPYTVLTTVSIVVSLGIFVFISASSVKNHQLFYLLFLPIICISIRYGCLGASASLVLTQLFLIAAVRYFHVDENQFGVFQTLMFILSVTGLLLGAVVAEREQSSRLVAEQRSELERVAARAATGAMASTLAHEISQPLSSLAAYVHGARRMLDGADMAEAVATARRALTMAESEAQRTRNIIERIRDFVSNGNLRLEAVDLGQLVDKIKRLNTGDARARGVELATLNDAALVPVTADRIALEQALNNLVTNAIDSASNRGDSRGQVMIRCSRRGENAVLEVGDNGAGVPPEIADRLFEVFETTKPKGMGLGLPLALQIAQKHSGRLGWRPLKPAGASFFIEFPIRGPERNPG